MVCRSQLSNAPAALGHWHWLASRLAVLASMAEFCLPMAEVCLRRPNSAFDGRVLPSTPEFYFRRPRYPFQLMSVGLQVHEDPQTQPYTLVMKVFSRGEFL